MLVLDAFPGLFRQSRDPESEPNDGYGDGNSTLCNSGMRAATSKTDPNNDDAEPVRNQYPAG